MTMDSDQALTELRFQMNRLDIVLDAGSDDLRDARVTSICSRMHELLDEVEYKESAGRTLRDSKGLSGGDS